MHSRHPGVLARDCPAWVVFPEPQDGGWVHIPMATGLLRAALGDMEAAFSFSEWPLSRQSSGGLRRAPFMEPACGYFSFTALGACLPPIVTWRG